jgi:hypothetical protein
MTSTLLLLGTIFISLAVIATAQLGASRLLFLIGAIFFGLSSACEAFRTQYLKSYLGTMEQAPRSASDRRRDVQQLERMARR